MAVTEIDPASCQTSVPEGLIVAAAEGLTANDTKYWVFQFHVMFEAAVIVNVTADAAPEAGTLPAPVQPVHTYCIPAPPEIGDATAPVMLDPLSNQPLTGEGES